MREVLVVRHVPDESLGLLAEALAAHGLTYRYLLAGADPFPELSSAAGLVVLGGPMNCDETDLHPFLRDEPAWIARSIAEGIPVLGICLGAQLVAQSQGGTVFHHTRKEIGWYRVELTAESRFDPLFRDELPQTVVFQWHGDTYSLPPGAVRLATGSDCIEQVFRCNEQVFRCNEQASQCTEQAFRLGDRVYGLQFHPEVTQETIDRWLDEPEGRRELADLGLQADSIRRETVQRYAESSAWSLRILGRFAQLCASQD